jgi:ABC-2 type transport system permease protein
MYALVKIELFKVFTRKRSYIGFVAIILIVLIAQAAMLWEGESMHQFVTSNLQDAFYLQGNLMNGYLMTYLVLNFLWVHIPLLVVIVTGDLFSGEAHAGTFRLILTRPVSKVQLVTAKFIAGYLYTFTLMLLFGITSLGLGLLLFGKGDLMVIFNAINVIPETDLLWRFMVSFVYGFIGMLAVASLSMLLSSMANNSLSPILVTMALIIFFTMITSFNLAIFSPVKPFLLTNYLDSWQGLFSLKVNLGKILMDGSILIFHSFVFYIITIIYFRQKDITT